MGLYEKFYVGFYKGQITHYQATLFFLDKWIPFTLVNGNQCFL